MASVSKLKCNNSECSFQTVRESNFPIWKSDSPKVMRKLPVGIRFKAFVAGYITRQYCVECKALQPFLKGSDMCLMCKKEGLFLQEGSTCPSCNTGVIESMNDLWF